MTPMHVLAMVNVYPKVPSTQQASVYVMTDTLEDHAVMRNPNLSTIRKSVLTEVRVDAENTETKAVTVSVQRVSRDRGVKPAASTWATTPYIKTTAT